MTIDPEDAKDHDDAVHAEPDPDPNNPGGFILRVAIADVAAYVSLAAPLDNEALDRGNSVYFPDRVVPMLPERISNDLCSLRPNEDRPGARRPYRHRRATAASSASFHRVMMRSAAKLSYRQAQAAIDGADRTRTRSCSSLSSIPLYAAYRALKIARDERGPLDLDLPERKIILDEKGAVDPSSTPPRLDAHRLSRNS